MRTKFILISVLSLCLFSFQSCLKDDCQREITYLNHTPIHKTLDEIRVPVSMESQRELKQPGKIYFFNDLIFIN